MTSRTDCRAIARPRPTGGDRLHGIRQTLDGIADDRRHCAPRTTMSGFDRMPVRSQLEALSSWTQNRDRRRDEDRYLLVRRRVRCIERTANIRIRRRHRRGVNRRFPRGTTLRPISNLVAAASAEVPTSRCCIRRTASAIGQPLDRRGMDAARRSPARRTPAARGVLKPSGAPSASVTVAPASLAIRTAAAMSHSLPQRSVATQIGLVRRDHRDAQRDRIGLGDRDQVAVDLGQRVGRRRARRRSRVRSPALERHAVARRALARPRRATRSPRAGASSTPITGCRPRPARPRPHQPARPRI